MATTSRKRVFVVGVGMTKFTKPGSTGKDYPDLIKEAVVEALDDCKLKYEQIEQATCGYLYGETCCGQRGLYQLGMTGIPIYNLTNACASGSSGLLIMRQFIQSGTTNLGLCVGFEKMLPGPLDGLGQKLPDRTQPYDKHLQIMVNKCGLDKNSPWVPQMFANAALEHMQEFGTTTDHFAKIAWKNHKHSVNNPRSQFQKEFTLEKIKKSPVVHAPIRMLECCPASDGAAAAVLCSEEFLESHPYLKDQAVEILGMQLGTDPAATFSSNTVMQVLGYDLNVNTANKVYAEAGLGPNDIQIIELHDCFAPNELFMYEALGLCPRGKGSEIVDRGDNTYGGKWVINPSGGLESKGHPVGATGVAQCAEVCWHLRGKAGKRQVPNARVGLQHNIGLGTACFIAMYKLGFPKNQSPTSSRL